MPKDIYDAAFEVIASARQIKETEVIVSLQSFQLLISALNAAGKISQPKHGITSYHRNPG